MLFGSFNSSLHNTIKCGINIRRMLGGFVMTDELLEQMRQEYNDMETIAKGDYSEIAKLELDANVQRYRYLSDLKRRYEVGFIQSTLWEIINKYGHSNITSSNPIWFRFHELLVEDYLKMFGAPLWSFEPGRFVTIYYDVENSAHQHIIYSDEIEDFESKNIIVKGDTTIDDPMDRFNAARAKYFTGCITYGKEAALQMLKEEEQNRNM